MKVYQAINAVQTDLAKEGIGKDRKNDQQGYKFRGIDDMYNAIAPLLAKHKLCILPAFAERVVTERQTQKGGTLFYVNVAGTFTFVCAEDGSTHAVGPFYGEAMDSGDKATNKAQSASFKYMCMQTFCIPTEGDNDADATTHEVKPVSITPAAGAVDRLEAGRKESLDRLVADCTTLLVDGDIQKAFSIIQNIEDADEKVYAWSQFDSKSRSAMKKHAESLKPEKKAA